MKLDFLLKHIRDITDPSALVAISQAVKARYGELLKWHRLGSGSLTAGDVVSFHLKDGSKIRGIIERRGKRNFRILSEDGLIYRVPHLLVRKEKAPQPAPAAPLPAVFERMIALLIGESRRLLQDSGIQLHVKFKRDVWATHFRPDRHIQYGEKCLQFQLRPHGRGDNVGANLRRFRLKNDTPGRLAMLVCHEVAHAIAHSRYGPRITPHGRQYYAVLAELISADFAEVRERFRTLVESVQCA